MTISEWCNHFMKADASNENTLVGMQHFLKISSKNKNGMCNVIEIHCPNIFFTNLCTWQPFRLITAATNLLLQNYVYLMRDRNWFLIFCKIFIIIKIKVVDLSKIAVVAEFRYMNAGNLNHVWCEINRHFRKQGREYLKDKITDLETNSKGEDLDIWIEV